MKKRLKRLVTSVSALFVMLLILAGTSAEAVVPSPVSSCNDAGGCAAACLGNECDDIGACGTYCLSDLCEGGGVWVGCVPDDL